MADIALMDQVLDRFNELIARDLKFFDKSAVCFGHSCFPKSAYTLLLDPRSKSETPKM